MLWRTLYALSLRRIEQRLLADDCILSTGEEPPLASHLVTPRALYTHHGIYVGSGRVIHYSGLAYGLRRGPVENVSLAAFAHGRIVCVRPEKRCFAPGEVVERARSRLGERRYRLLSNNCEHFCVWALSNERRSVQVERAFATPRRWFGALCVALARLEARRPDGRYAGARSYGARSAQPLA